MDINQLPAAFVHGNPTFWGCYFANRDQITHERGWNSDTVKGYESSILNKIVRNIPNHDTRPLKSLTKEDFVKTLESIRKEGYMGENGNICSYDEETLNRFWYIMEVVTETAEKNFICRNVLAMQTDTPSLRVHNTVPGKMVPRYMPPALEQRTGDILLTDPMQDGCFMGLAGMFSWGGRNAEAAGLNFGDVKEWPGIPGCWVAWIYKTTKVDSNDLQSSGKTRNADRVVLLPDKYVRLVLERKKRLKELLDPDVNVDDLPIACRGNNYFTRCSSDDLTVSAKTLFSMLKVPTEHIALVYEDIQQALSDDADPLNRLNLDLIEKEPTAYYLRRIYGTSISAVGLSDQDVAFQIGHDLGNVPEFRNELLNTTKLLELKDKLNQRPVVNTLKQALPSMLPRNSAVSLSDSGTVIYRLPKGVRRVQLHIAAREPQDTIRVFIRVKKHKQIKLNATAYDLEPDKYSTELDVTADYHSLYNKHED